MTSALYALTLTLCGAALFEGITNALFGKSKTKGHVLFVFSLAALVCVVNTLLPVINGKYEYPDFEISEQNGEFSSSEALEKAVEEILTEEFGLGKIKINVELEKFNIEKVEVVLYDVSDFIKVDKIKTYLDENIPCDTEVRCEG